MVSQSFLTLLSSQSRVSVIVKTVRVGSDFSIKNIENCVQGF